ncbi:MAG: gephyrin-like molybdotransferase Glp [Bacteroidota bacterium]
MFFFYAILITNTAFMISVEQAKKLLLRNVNTLHSSDVNIIDSLGSILQQDIVSPLNLPPFDQSSMDGYAIRYADHFQKGKIKIEGEIPAGKSFKKKLKAGQAVRIFTGAPVPIGADTVVIQEKIRIENGYLIINDPLLKQGANIRKAGAQIKKGAIALQKKTIITPGGIGYIAAMGITTVKVISKPVITIIVTGSELKKPGKQLNNGQVYESNSFAIEAALNSIGLKAKNIFSVKDIEKEVFKTIKTALKNSDIILITGGISVGDYDFTEKSLHDLGVETIFYKVKQKPGKPLYFGKNKETLIFALPGNPAAVLSCFYEYVYPAIKLMQGFKNIFLPKIQQPISTNYSKKKGLSFFLKGKISNDQVIPLEGQESYVLSSFATADCLIFLPENSENIKKGQIVEVHKLPGIVN